MVAGAPKIRTALIEGPYKVTGVSASPSRDRIFVCRPSTAAEELACATRIFTNLTRRAYRRPVTAADVQAPIDFYKQARQSGEAFDAGIRVGLARMLSSTSFIYRMESDPADAKPGSAHPVSDVELASRLKKALEEIFDLPCIVIDWNQYIVNVSQAAETIYEHEEEDLYG